MVKDDLFQANPLSIADLGGMAKTSFDNFYNDNRGLILFSYKLLEVLD
jgi:hypothetical protein